MKYVAALLIGLTLVLSGLAVFKNYQTQPVPMTAIDNKYQCNRYGDAKSNFEILSIVPIGADDVKGKYLSDNIDNIKAWLTTRWAFPNEPFSVKCKIVLTANQDIFKDVFIKESPQFRVLRDGQKLKEVSIWLSTDDPRWDTNVLTGILTEISLQELEVAHGKMAFWVHRGMPIMNSSFANIRQNIGNLSLIYDKDLPVYWSKEILNMTPEIFAKQPQASAVWYDSESACFMLMLYKEFGSKKFDSFISECRTNNPEIALKTVYGYNSYAECDVAFKQYMQNLSRDLTGRGNQITPNTYLTWPIP